MTTTSLRRVVQGVVVLLTLDAGLSLALGWPGAHGVERFCPFGGMETLWAVLRGQTFTCAMGRYNLAMMMALLATALVARKAFCSWICPVGTVSEWLARLGARFRRGETGSRYAPRLGVGTPPKRWDQALRTLRIPVLVLLLVFTAQTGELIFRPYDPYYVLFSFHGHEVRWWSYLPVGGLLATAVAVSMAWCRYLCPLGLVLWPFSRIGWLRIRRRGATCIDCGLCDAACPHDLDVSQSAVVRSGECTLCLRCVSACDRSRSLSLTPGGLPGLTLPGWTAALLLAAAVGGGLLGAEAFAFPTYRRTYAAQGAPSSVARTVVFEVEGLRCRETARQCADQLDTLPGVMDLSAFGADHRLQVTYDPERVSPEALRLALEGPVFIESTGEFLFHQYRVTEIQGVGLSRD